MNKNPKEIDPERKTCISHYAVLQPSGANYFSTDALTKICDALDRGIDDIIDVYFLGQK